MLNKFDYSIQQLKAIISAKNALLVAYRESASVLQVTENDNSILKFIFTLNPKFHFTILNLTPNIAVGSEVLFDIRYSPKNDQQQQQFTFPAINFNGLSTYFNIWLSNINAYLLLNPNVLTDFSDDYAKEFYDEFELVDDDNLDKETFPDKVQSQLYDTLALISNVIQSEPNYLTDEKLKEIVNELDSISNDIPKLNKRQTMKRLSWVKGKMKSYGFKFFKKVFEIAATELGKRAVNALIDHGPDIAKKFIGLIGG